MTTKAFFLSILLAASSSFLSLQAQATQVNLLTNGGFESSSGYTPTGWSVSSTNSVYVFASNNLSTPQAGSYWLATQNGTTILSQTFGDVAGDTLALSGWLDSFKNGSILPDTNSVNLLFNGTTVASYQYNSLIPWTELTASVVASGTDTFSVKVFGGNATTSAYPYYATGLDSFSVVDTTPQTSTSGSSGGSGSPAPSTPVPTPPVALLMFLSLAWLALTTKRVSRLV